MCIKFLLQRLSQIDYLTKANINPQVPCARVERESQGLIEKVQNTDIRYGQCEIRYLLRLE